ncbi:DUF6090 family protein [Xanthomarina sp. GH4-25]|uniref:DUF6090 family protein n=1 Tax=Xanthomarina sp. GH4-25 TaxID=3349335 RepID=UPI000D684793|nr:hypothetical protein DI383_11140 [Flavobacteriaceae bacterium LYZ1037]
MKKGFRYALGEILIVIVGLSIAFSMNKCAEINKNDSLKQQYLSSIKSDIKIDKENLEKNLISIGQKIQSLNEVLPLINTDNPEKISSIKNIFGLFTLVEFYPKDITYQTMINSGDFKLIDNFNTKTAIESHYSDYKSILKDYERQEIIHKEYLGKYMIENADYDAMRKGQFGFSNEKLFKNILQSMTGSLYIKKNATERGIKNCDSLLNLLY